MSARPRNLALTMALAVACSGCAHIPFWVVAQGGRSTIDDHRHFANAPLAAAAQSLPLPAAPEPVRWPQGVPPEQLQAWMQQGGTVALLMVRRGQLVAEHYAPGYGRDSVLTSFSIAKSVVSALVGIAQAEGRLSVTDPVTRWLPELRGNDARFEQVRLIDLLRMRSGIRFDESYSAPNSEAARFCCLNARAVDFARFGMLFLNEGRAGSHQVVPADWVRTSSAAQQALPGADDAARRNVEWRGQGRRSAFYALQWRRAPAAAPASTSAPAPDSAQALPGTDFYAQGLHGQFVYVAPQSDTVVLRFGRSAGEVFWPAWLGEWARLNP